MKWWAWLLIGVVVLGVTSLIGWAMYKRERRGNPDSLAKAREAKAGYQAERQTPADPEPSDNGQLTTSDKTGPHEAAT